MGLVGVLITLGTDSDTDKIIKAIQDIGTQVSELKDIMNTRFDRLESVIEWQNAKSQITDHLNLISTVGALMSDYGKYAHDPIMLKVLEDKLMDYTSKDLDLAMNGIVTSATGESLATNIFDAALGYSFGDISEIVNLGKTLLVHCAIGLMANVLLGTLKHKDDVDSALAEAKYAAKRYEESIDKVYSAWERAIRDCQNQALVYQNLDNFMKVRVISDLPSDNHKIASKTIIDQLKSRWPLLDFFVAVYDPVTGWEKHAMMRGRKDALTLFRKEVNDGKINIVIHWVKKTVPPQGNDRNTRVVGYQYEGSLMADPYPIWKEFNGNAEDGPFKDVRDLLQNLNPPYRYPVLLFAMRNGSKKSKEPGFESTNDDRLTLKQGKNFSVVIHL